jgi:hypothetical protein
MPPQQSDGLLGGFALALDFGAHGEGLPGKNSAERAGAIEEAEIVSGEELVNPQSAQDASSADQAWSPQ